MSIFKIRTDRIKTDPAKHKAIIEYSVPTNGDDVSRFIAFCNYYSRFISDFAKLTKFRNNLVQKGQMDHRMPESI